MKVFLLSVLAVYVQGETCNPNCDACTDDHDIAKITCEKGADCSIEKGSAYGPDENVDYLLGEPGEPKIKEITADGCREKCKEQMKDSEHPQVSEDKCLYFHWQEVHEAVTDKIITTCSLQTTCQPSGYCESFDCVSGQLGCDEECEPSLPCSLTKTDWVHGYFHVICTDKTQEDGNGDVDIYSDNIEGKEIPGGTICNTIRKCSEWTDQAAEDATNYFRQLAVQCDGSTGTWGPRDDTGSNDLSTKMIEDNKIIEQECAATCLPLAIPTLDAWADLVCDEPLVDNAIAVPNSCILLCDNHLRMTIDCKYVVEGDKIWQDAHGEPLTTADLTC